ncbi:hypothetical protein AB5J55_00605 [Streptomyces sp. R11]|uniref:Uncharacterized protein n=1 Tax=Streptomyces sp. R11 TaxID=3238625 RepID=A0AB39MQ50_9ACTN
MAYVIGLLACAIQGREFDILLIRGRSHLQGEVVRGSLVRGSSGSSSRSGSPWCQFSS